ncbi:MAG: hypothetical protein A3E87_08515 [Gammaproteobacteria bacterium RIFCSPHIGHO2_12_FULL_35_23]|nr:MAG: hypothetical protein A3E87_08515 [Gammaproteobacteria bacterium RIFCSPHIGHO2_12_FULL_35_23]
MTTEKSQLIADLIGAARYQARTKIHPVRVASTFFATQDLYERKAQLRKAFIAKLHVLQDKLVTTTEQTFLDSIVSLCNQYKSSLEQNSLYDGRSKEVFEGVRDIFGSTITILGIQQILADYQGRMREREETGTEMHKTTLAAA